MEHTQNNSLPIDAQIDILRRLPVKSLVQHKCVSKHWRTLITSERFSKVYHQMNNQNNQSDQNSITSNPLILVGTSTILSFDFSSTQSTVFKLPNPPTLLLTHHSLIGSDNGLLCLQHPPLSTQTIALYSPISRAYKVLPSLKTNRDYMIYHNIGLGYDHKSNDFKIVSLQDRPYIFRLRSNTWDVIQLTEPKFDNYGLRKTMVVSNNALHWLPLVRKCSTSSSILAFDLGTELFYNVPMPDYSGHGYRKQNIISWDLTDVKGYLHLSITTKLFDTSRFPEIVIWIMKEYGVKQSWTKLLCYTSKEFCYMFVIPTTSIVFRPRVYAYSKDDQEVLLGVELNPKIFFSCHLRTRKVKKVKALCNLVDEEDKGFSVVPWTCTFASCE